MAEVRVLQGQARTTKQDGFLLERTSSRKASEKRASASAGRETDEDNRRTLGGFLGVMAHMALDMILTSWEETPGGQGFGTSIDGFIRGCSDGAATSLGQGMLNR